jgi:exopolysaccharide biosynthesis polyprenyl glycosylphosphotransferase
VIGTLDQLREILIEQVVDEMIFTIPFAELRGADSYITLAETLGVSVRIFPDWQIQRLKYKPRIASIEFEEFFGIPSLSLKTISRRQGQLAMKGGLDYLLASIAMLLLLPFLVLLSIAIKVASGGPILFKQERCGIHGRRFEMYKFRTMGVDAEKRQKELEGENEADGPVFKMKNDPRVISFLGTFLRNTGLDELPQLINVLKGEMSLVGPRPPIPDEVEKYDIWQRRRLSVKPGLTCLWQIAPNRNEVSFHEWMDLDLRYVDNWSLWYDIWILLKTVRAVLTGAGR